MKVLEKLARYEALGIKIDKKEVKKILDELLLEWLKKDLTINCNLRSLPSVAKAIEEFNKPVPEVKHEEKKEPVKTSARSRTAGAKPVGKRSEKSKIVSKSDVLPVPAKKSDSGGNGNKAKNTGKVDSRKK